MDKKDDKGYGEEEFSYADEDGTSFNTASDGYAERLETDTIGTSMDGESPRTDNHANIPSSRHMPLPEYLQHGRNAHLPANPSNEELPPPSYDEVINKYGKAAEPYTEPEEPEETDPMNRPHGAEGGKRDEVLSPRDEGVSPRDEGLSPTEVALIMKMRDGRDTYLPDRRGSYEEAVEMLSPEEKNSNIVSLEDYANWRDTGVDTEGSGRDEITVNPSDIETYVDNIDTSGNGQRLSRRTSLEIVENGHQDQTSRSSNKLIAYLQRQPINRLILIGILIVAAVGLVLFLGLFPASFVYVEYHEIALKQSKLTNVVNRDEVFYTGCYVLGPDTQFVRFQASVHNVVEEISVFTLDTIPITMRYSAHYFIRPKEVGQLYTMFTHDYDPVFKKIITSSIRTLAGSIFSVDNFRFNRTYVEREMHVMLRKRLGGDCCPDCCPAGCQSNLICGQCKTSNCNQGYHVDVRYFFLMEVTIPHEVFERYLRFTILEIEKEKEFFLQDHAVTSKETELLTQQVKNEAKEIISKANAERDKILVLAEASKEQIVQKSYAQGLHKMYSGLNITNEEHKLSLMMVHMLEDQADNLYAGYAYDKNTLAAP